MPFQLDRFANDLRDIESRIFRLENKQKLFPRSWTREDEAELHYWRNERAKFQQRMDVIRKRQRPMHIQ